MPRPVVDVVTGHLAREAAIAGYEAVAEAGGCTADAYDAIAALIQDADSFPTCFMIVAAS